MNIKKTFIDFFESAPVQGIKKGFHKFANLLTDAINHGLLTFVYIMGFGLTKLFAVISKKHFLEIQKGKNASTCWKDISHNEYKNRDFYRMF